MLTRKLCIICHHINAIRFRVSDEIWDNLISTHLELSRKLQINWNKEVCLNCFTRLADEQLIKWDKNIEFFPVSLATSLSLEIRSGKPS